MLQDPETSVWVEAQQAANGSDFFAWCGWETKYAKWGAIWRYQRDWGEYYVTTDDASRDFVADDAFSSLTVDHIYRFNFSAGAASLDDATGSVTKTTGGGVVTFTVPHVSENPILIRFK
jgi:hypothetical protein